MIANHTFTFDSFFRTGVIMDSGTHSEVSDCFFFGNDAPAMISGRDWAGGSQRYERNYILIPAGS